MIVIPPQAQTDGAFARASTATFVSDAGVVASAAVDEARYQAGALLLEPAATNLLWWSENFGDSAWAKIGVTVSVNAVAAPDGTSTADLLVEGTGSGGHYAAQTIGVTAGLSYTASAHFKLGTGTRYPQIIFPTAAFGANRCGSFDLQAGLCTDGGTGALVSMTALGNGWWRCAVTAVATVTRTTGVQFRLGQVWTPVAQSYVGDGASSLAVWGAQVEAAVAAEPASSYIPTAGGEGTRAADVFTRGMLSNVPEADHAAYAGGTTYALGDRVVLASTHRIYESLQAANTGHAPDTSPTWWLDAAPTNRWAMFDAEYSTVTALATSPLRVVLAPAYANSIALLGLVGSSVLVTVADSGNATLAYSRTVDLRNPFIVDWYGYIYEPFDQVQEVVLNDLPAFLNAVVTVTLTGGPATACALLALGAAVNLGDVSRGVRLNIVDYSRKETDAFGVATLIKRAFSRRLTLDLLLPNANLNVVYRALSNLRATPCVWQVTDDEALQVLVLWGFYKDFSVTIAYPTQSQCALELEGMI